jgi:hypothetical protein
VNPLSKRIVEHKTAMARQGHLPPEADASINLATQYTHMARKRVIREEEYRKT